MSPNNPVRSTPLVVCQSICVCVCVSVCLWHAGIVSNWLN